MSALRRFVAIDVETGGLNPETDALLEVGLVVERADGSTFEEAFIIPDEAATRGMEPAALKINKYHERRAAGVLPAPASPAFVAVRLRELTRGAHLIGANPEFDAAFLANLMRRHGVEPEWHHRMVSLGSLVWGFYNAGRANAPVTQPPATKAIERLLGEPNDEAHTALGDARWNYRVFRQIVPRPGPPYPPRHELPPDSMGP